MCHPLAEMEEDPGVIYHTYVEDFVVLRDDLPTYKALGCYSGVMYIKNNHVYYNMKCGTTLCCIFYRRRFKLRDIHTVEVVENETVQIFGYRYYHEVVFSSGLKITLGDTTVVVSVPAEDAIEFARELRQACNLQTVAEEDVEIINRNGTVTTLESGHLIASL
jgi:hypothetical protein